MYYILHRLIKNLTVFKEAFRMKFPLKLGVEMLIIFTVSRINFELFQTSFLLTFGDE